jgi:hypothetical protein
MFYRPLLLQVPKGQKAVFADAEEPALIIRKQGLHRPPVASRWRAAPGTAQSLGSQAGAGKKKGQEDTAQEPVALVDFLHIHAKNPD